MHIRPSQVNPNLQLDAMYAGKGGSEAGSGAHQEKTDGFCFEIGGETESGEASIVEIGAREESREESSQEEQQDMVDPQKPKDETHSHDAEGYLSDWV